MKSNKLKLDKDTLTRLQNQQMNAAVGGADGGYESNVVKDEAGLRADTDGGDPPSCCSKSCNRRD